MIFNRKKKVLIIGLDCAAPELMFKKYIDELPVIKKMAQSGSAGFLKSSYPPITVPAWMVMHTGMDAGELGLYGFRYRDYEEYENYKIVSSSSVKEKRIWDYLGNLNKKSIIVGVPMSYPVFPVKGNLISGFLTPGCKSQYTYPSSLKNEIYDLVGEYPFDVVFRTDDKDSLIKNLYDMTDKHFKVIEYLIKNKQWDFFSFVEIGLDRIHHAFWKYFDEKHWLHDKNNKYKNTVKDYYKYLDGKIGRLLEIIPKNTVVLIVSDHGAKRMEGCFCINEWLIREGFLKLKKYPDSVKNFSGLNVDWENTTAWGWGGYYARVFINKQGRESKGVVTSTKYQSFRDNLAEKLSSIKGPNGEKLDTIVHKPEEFYNCPKGQYPDLMVYFDNLYYRSAGTVGHKCLFLKENDTGPDGAVHDWNGVFVMYDLLRDKKEKKINLKQYNILDICPTVLNKFKIKIPSKLKGSIIS